MARRFTLQIIMDLASRIGANPAKAISRSNVSFLGKGPTKNPLFQNRLAGLENATPENLGDPKKLFGAIDDAVGWMKDGKLNSIQSEILGHNLSGIEKILHPPALPTLPMASVTPIRSGIGGLRKSPQRVQEIVDDMAMIEDPASVGLKRFPKESHKFFGRPLKNKDFSEIDRMIMEGKIPDARGRTWNLKTPGTGTSSKLDQLRRETAIKDLMKDKPPGYKLSEEQIRQYMIGRRAGFKHREWEGPGDKNLWGPKSRLPETGTGEVALQGAMTAKTGMSRAIARHILLQDTRIKLPAEILTSLRMSRDLAKGAEKYGPKYDPIEIMRRYYGRSMMNFDEWMDNILTRRVAGANASELADLALKEIELLPQFAEGGLAEILQAPRSGYGDGRSVKNFIGPLQEQNVISEGVDTSGWGDTRADIIAQSGFQNKSLLDFLSEKSNIGSNKYNLKLNPSAELNVSKFSSGEYDIKNKNIWLGLSSILNLGPFSADIDYGKIKDKIKVKSRKDATTVYKDARDDEMLAYKLGYAKDGLNMDVRTDKSLNNFLFSLNKQFKRKPKYIFKKATGGLARILEV